MAFFSKESKEEKHQKEVQKFMEKYGLESVEEQDVEILNKIANDLVGNGFFKTGMALSFAKAEEQAKVTYLSALVEQNWLMLRQLNKLNSNIEKLLDK